MYFTREESIDISFVMPCLDEVNSVGICVDKAFGYIKRNALSGEVIVVDNGSTDGSAAEAEKHGATVIYEENTGYGNAIRKGMQYSAGRVMLIGDCDMTYDFDKPDDMIEMLLNKDFEVVIGDRLSGNMQQGAMPYMHKLGVYILSYLGRMRFKVDIRDFHCGIRALTREAAEKMDLNCNGMEFATEMIAEAGKKGLKTGQIPVPYIKSEYKRRSKLKPVKDGLRHLDFILR